MAYITEGNLSDSVLYKNFNSAAKLSSTIVTAIKNSIEIDNSYIQEQLMQIQRTRLSPLVDKVLNAYKNGDIVILYARKIKIPQALPFFAMKAKSGKPKVFIFANNFASIGKSETDSDQKFLNISMKDLYALMEGAYITYVYNSNPKSFSRSLGLQKLTSKIYSQMMLQILNKEYALSMDQELTSEVTFIISYFFMKYVWGSENDAVNISYSLDTCTQTGKYSLTSTNKAEMIVEEMDTTVSDISSLIKFIETRSKRLKGLTFRYFTQTFVNTFKGPSIFAMECLPYFLFTVCTASLGSFIVNTPMITNITSNIKGMNQFYPEIGKIG